MTDPQTIQTLWQYMVYADEQMLVAAATVPPENDDRDFGISFGSIREVLTHSYEAQLRWLGHMNGSPGPGAPPSREELPARWAESHRSLLEFAAAQDAGSMTRMVNSVARNGTPFSLPLGLCMLHVSDHATYHRGQLNSLIKLAGGKPSGVMLFSYAKDKE